VVGTAFACLQLQAAIALPQVGHIRPRSVEYTKPLFDPLLECLFFCMHDIIDSHDN